MIIKAAAYALLGYVLYELVLGITEGEASPEPAGNRGSVAHSSGRRDMKRAMNEDTGRMNRRNEGENVRVEDNDGGSRNQNVGRGVKQ